jgi:hypothetical protein
LFVGIYSNSDGIYTSITLSQKSTCYWPASSEVQHSVAVDSSGENPDFDIMKSSHSVRREHLKFIG